MYHSWLLDLTDSELEQLKRELRKAIDNLPALDPKATPPIAVRIPAPPGTRGTPNDPDPTPPMFPELAPPVKKKCECGADKVGSPRHSSWCPLFDD